MVRPRWRLFALSALAVLLFGCEERKPIGGSPEYLAAHGIAENTVNRIKVGQVVWEIPPQYRPMPYSSGAIVKGQASTLMVKVPLPPTFIAPSADPYPAPVLTIHLYASGTENEQTKADSLSKQKWTSITPRADLGLLEYLDARGQPMRSYKVLDDSYKTPRGGTIIFTCKGPDRPYPAECDAAYLHPNGPLVWYYFPGYLLPRWREVHAEAINIVNSFVAK